MTQDTAILLLQIASGLAVICLLCSMVIVAHWFLDR